MDVVDNRWVGPYVTIQSSRESTIWCGTVVNIPGIIRRPSIPWPQRKAATDDNTVGVELVKLTVWVSNGGVLAGILTMLWICRWGISGAKSRLGVTSTITCESALTVQAPAEHFHFARFDLGRSLFDAALK